MKFFKTLFLILGLITNLAIYAQNAPFNITLEAVNIPELGGLQSYAFGQHDGKWLIVGGRLDGLHRRQPFATFDIAGHNTQLIVIDPVKLKKWTAPLSSLSKSLQEQLSSTNMEFYQHDDYLYIAGGYGYSATVGDHTTFANLTAIDVPSTIEAIIDNKSFTGFFRQIQDNQFQVTGGYLEKIYDDYYLVGGQKFIGRYNPMGPDHGPGFTQEYTNQIRKFSIDDDGTNLKIMHVKTITDTNNLHRRDYNVSPQIMPNESEGLTAFSGVFQKNVDLPYLNCVNIDSAGYTVNNAFTQYYNHYHCANLSAYSKSQNQMHTVFFGGIAQYYDSGGILVQNNNVPFVKTIARVTRNASGLMQEFKLPAEMPSLLGAGSEFIIDEDLSSYKNGVIKLDDLTKDTTTLGYIYGGISSSGPNIFWINDGTQSSASNTIFKVKLIKNAQLSIHTLNEQSSGTLKLEVYPNPNPGNFMVKYNLTKTCDVRISIYTINGKKIEDKVFEKMPAGENVFEKRIRNLENGGVYMITIETDYEKATQRIVYEP